MKTFKIMVGLFLAMESVMAVSWTKMELDVSATLREQKSGVLEKLIELPKGTILKYAKSVGATRYRADNGSVKMSTRGWYRYIMLETVPGVSDSRINEINKKTLFISSTVAAGVSTAAGSGNDSAGDVARFNSDPEIAYNGDIEACRDKFVESGIKPGPLDKTLDYFKRNNGDFENKRYVAIADFSQPYKNKRYSLLDLKTCKVYKEQLAHGRNGGQGVNSRPTYCGSAPSQRSQQTRAGFAKAKGYHWRNQNNPKSGWTYITDSRPKKQALKLFGLQSSNREMLDTGVVMHERQSMNPQGTYRSYGCPVMYPTHLKALQSVINKGTLLYIYIPECE